MVRALLVRLYDPPYMIGGVLCVKTVIVVRIALVNLVSVALKNVVVNSSSIRQILYGTTCRRNIR